MKVFGVYQRSEGPEYQVPVAARTLGQAKVLAAEYLRQPWLDWLDLAGRVAGEIDGEARVLSDEEAERFGWVFLKEDDL